MKSVLAAASVFLIMTLTGGSAAQTPPPPPEPVREFRGAWIATVSNIDWPLGRTRTTAQNQADLRAQLDIAVQMRMNAIIFQVRPACDAMYASTIEPWSYWLTNLEGRAPSPAWDPLAFVIEEAHARGLELHAWFNPYRAKTTSNYTLAANHIANRRPDLVRPYDGFLWLDPGEPDVQDYSLSVVMDVVNRYNIDAVHFDDYFYPYPVTGVPFPDAETYARYQAGGGSLSLADWRRDSVNRFIRRVGESIKEVKPTVRYGISPFGIWRPGNPPGTTGLDSFSSIYADSRLWIREGWVDYLAPQLYWEIDPPAQSFPALLDWWILQNWQNRHIWPGTALYKMSGTTNWPASEITRQVIITRQRPASRGAIHFSFRDFRNNTKDIRTELTNNVYTTPALVPTSPWMDATLPAPPLVTIGSTSDVTLQWTPQGSKPAFRYVVSWYRNNAWEQTIVNRGTTSTTIPNSIAQPPTHVSVATVDRLGNMSQPNVKSLAVSPAGWVLH